ncbi:MAG: AMP-binding protein [Desulfomonilaceae bacterium]|nr:AMP-binding protein [Desulfomonilaceae bacterium]
MHHMERNSGILNPEETYSAEERRSRQEGFLRDLVAGSYGSNTPLKAVMDAAGLKPADISCIEDLQKIPVTKKTDLARAQKANPPFGGFLTVPPSQLLRIHQSPGPIYDPVGRVPDYWKWKTALYSVGFRPGDLVVNTFAYHLTPAGHMFEEGMSELGGTVIPTGVGNTDTQVEIMKNLPVTGYIGTPSFLMAILKKAESMQVDVKKDFSLEVAFLLAEMLPESMRKRFLDDYGITGRQAYGTADVGCVSYECPETNGMHIHYDAIVEIVDPGTGKALPNGEPGEVVVTRNNQIYPLVRFGTGDLSSIEEGLCPCGRTAPRLTRIMGRVDQLTKVKGMFVHPSQVQKVVDSHLEIAKGRLVVDRAGDQDVMTLEVELKSPAGEAFIGGVEQTLRDAVKLKGSVKIVETGTIKEDGKIIEDLRKWD